MATAKNVGKKEWTRDNRPAPTALDDIRVR